MYNNNKSDWVFYVCCSIPISGTYITLYIPATSVRRFLTRVFGSPAPPRLLAGRSRKGKKKNKIINE